MNRFIGPDRSASLWYSAGRRPAKDAHEAAEMPPETPAGDAGEMVAEIWLFGFLAALTTERPVKFRLRGNANAMDVLAALEERFGSDLLSRIRDPVKGVLPCCRIFVDGEPVEDVAAPLSAGGKAAKVELILLKGFEGG